MTPAEGTLVRRSFPWSCQPVRIPGVVCSWWCSVAGSCLSPLSSSLCLPSSLITMLALHKYPTGVCSHNVQVNCSNRFLTLFIASHSRPLPSLLSVTMPDTDHKLLQLYYSTEAVECSKWKELSIYSKRLSEPTHKYAWNEHGVNANKFLQTWNNSTLLFLQYYYYKRQI